jgi:hypothetical protein
MTVCLVVPLQNPLFFAGYPCVCDTKNIPDELFTAAYQLTSS